MGSWFSLSSQSNDPSISDEEKKQKCKTDCNQEYQTCISKKCGESIIDPYMGRGGRKSKFKSTFKKGFIAARAKRKATRKRRK